MMPGRVQCPEMYTGYVTFLTFFFFLPWQQTLHVTMPVMHARRINEAIATVHMIRDTNSHFVGPFTVTASATPTIGLVVSEMFIFSIAVSMNALVSTLSLECACH